MSMDGSWQAFRLGGFIQAGFDCSFSSGAGCPPRGFKGHNELAEPEPQQTVGTVSWNQTDTWVPILL